jgi:hypothetical protein
VKVITATSQTQGQRDSDFDFCVEGEIVTQTLVICGKDKEDPDGPCGCGRAWSGANSHRSTTTAMVRDLPLTTEEYTEAVRSSLEYGGWYPKYVDDGDLGDIVADLLEVAESYPVGAVLETRLGAEAWRDNPAT